MTAIPDQSVNPSGLHQRYRVAKANGDPVDPMATYFVLRLDRFGRDGIHVAACRAAARAYASAVEGTHLDKIGSQLRTMVDNFDSMGG